MLLFLIALVHVGLTATHLPYLQVISGWLLFLLPGVLLTETFYRRSLSEVSVLRRIVLDMLISISAVSLAMTLATSFGVAVRVDAFRVVYIVFMLGLIALYASSLLLRHLRGEHLATMTVQLRSLRSIHLPKWFVGATILSLGFVVLHMLLYRYLPEADGYGWGIVLRNTEVIGHLPVGVTRIQFVYLMQCSLAVLGVGSFWLFKVVLPLLVGTVFVLAGTALVARATLPNWVKGATVTLPFLVPVLVEELLVGRPQSFALMFFVGVALLLPDIVRGRKFDLFLLMLGISGVAFRFHELSMFLPVLLLIAAVKAYWPEIQASPKRAVFYIAVVAILLYLVIAPTEVGAYIRANIEQITGAIRFSNFRFWFINHYVNTDNIEIGWPGTQAILYYAYNLGVTLPILLILGAVIRGKKRFDENGRYFWILALLFFIFAEVLPRFGYFNLPDRAWIFLALSLVFAVQADISRMYAFLHKRNRALVLPVLALSMAISLGASVYITYAKQGRVTTEEHAAVATILNTPTSARFISQSLNDPLITYFGERTMVELPDFFLASSDAERHAAVNSLQTSIPDPILAVSGSLAKLRADLTTSAFGPEPLGASVAAEDQAQLNADYADYLQNLKKADEYAAVSSTQGNEAPLYVLYSTDKLKGLSATRDWWRKEAFSNFDPAVLKDSSWLKLVYQNAAVTIWQVTK